MRIGGFLPTTLLDYPGHLACTVFTQGCNLRCPFCQNGSLVLPDHFDPPLSEEEVLKKMEKRSGILEGVCVSGGEPTLQPDLEDFIRKVRSLGLKIKLDTNGSRPDILKDLCQKGLIDYVAMDVKAAPSEYARVCGLSAEGSDFFAPYAESVAFLKQSGIDHEFRTTLVKGLHTRKSMQELAAFLSGAAAWYLQSYEESSDVISLLEHGPGTFSGFSSPELNEFLSIAQEHVPAAVLRGVG